MQLLRNRILQKLNHPETRTTEIWRERYTLLNAEGESDSLSRLHTRPNPFYPSGSYDGAPYSRTQTYWYLASFALQELLEAP